MKTEKKVWLKRNRFLVSVIMVFSLFLLAQGKSADFARLRIVSIDWSEKSPDCMAIDTIIIRIFQEESFGVNNKPKYFKFLRVLDPQTIEIQFSEKLVVAGEPTNYQSKKNLVIISGNNNCFRAMYNDSGTDYCIDVLETGSK